MSKEKRRKKKSEAEQEILTKSRRRCCICYGLNRDATQKKGQIAHLDRDRTNDGLDNLAFLCFDHHDELDSETSQSKSLQLKEVKTYRKQLYEHLEKAGSEKSSGNDKELSHTVKTRPQSITIPLSEPHKCSQCGYGFHIENFLGKNAALIGATVTCPKCGNVDKVKRYFWE